MIRQRLGRTAAVFASLGLLFGSVGTVSAQNPNWFIGGVLKPTEVGAGHDAGYVITVGNNGPSNINQMRVIVTPLDLAPLAAGDEPTYLSSLAYAINGVPTTGPQNCTSQLPLTCELGTLVDHETVTFTVAYGVPAGLTGDFDVNVAIRAGTGDPDGKNNSRGDKTDTTFHTPIRGGNFDGGFVIAGGATYQTNPDLGNKNIQSTALSGAPELVPVTIEDGISTLAACDSATDDPACASLFGEWSRLNVNDGNGGVNFATPFKVTLMIRGSAVPGGVSAADIHFVHVLDDNSIQVISRTCTFAGTNPVPTNAECLTATKVGSNWKLEVWLFRNGAGRGGI